MSSPVSVFSTPAAGMKDSHTRRSIANFHPCIWKDHFISMSSNDLKVDDGTKERAEKLKEEIRVMLGVYAKNPLEKLKLVDSIQRLGVSYYFENEIDKILEVVYCTYKSTLLSEDSGEDLHTTSLLFRLLRQQGYKISCDIFTKFMEKNGKFKESLADDERGILSLYEAQHMRGHGEDVLEEALEFTTRHLKNIIVHSTPLFAADVSNALKWPIRKDIPRIKARQFLLSYQQDPHNNTLLTFSKLDFNILQKLHQQELSEICRWWKDLDVPTKFPFARDRIVETYFWTLGAYFEPNFRVGRKLFTKVIAVTSILDDTYDAYGTFEELQVLTQAIQRWDRSMVNILPEYMKPFYIAMLDVYEEMSKEIGKDENSYHIRMAKEGFIKLAESYFEEAKWLSTKYKPNFDEYMKLALNTTGYALVIITSILGMGDIVTNDVLEWFSKGPKIIEASTIICRLMDDIVSHKFEQEREHVASAVECYMAEHGCSEEEACAELQKKIVDAWKDVNEACLRPLPVSMPFLMRALNCTRVMSLLYLEDDGYTHSKGRTQFLIKSLLVDPVPY